MWYAFISLLHFNLKIEIKFDLTMNESRQIGMSCDCKRAWTRRGFDKNGLMTDLVSASKVFKHVVIF